MSVTSDTDRAGAETDPAQSRDKPLSWPPAGNPRIFGPGRGRNDERAMHVAYLLSVTYLLWMGKPEDFGSAGSGLWAYTGRDVAFALLSTIILGTMGLFLYRYPLHRMILRIDDHGLTLRSLGPFHDRPRSFVPFDRLAAITLHADGRHPPWDVLEIDLRRGPGWISWKFAARTATGTKGLEIAREVARRAEAAGVQVTPPEGSGFTKGRMIWRFSAEEGASP